MAINTGNIAKLLMPGLNSVWGDTYTDYPMEYGALFEIVTSEKNYEEDQLIPGFGLAPIKPQGQSITYDTLSQGLTTRYTHVAYAKGFVVTREAIADNQYKSKSLAGTKKLARSFRQTKENVGANVYNRGFSGSYVGADGVALFSTAHPTLAGNQANKAATDADMSEASIEDMLVLIAGATDEVGLKIALSAKSLVYPAALMFEATRILKSAGQNDTANNATNALRSMGMFTDGGKVNHYFTDTDAWFIRTDADQGMQFFQREAPEFASDNDFDTYNLKFKGYERYSCGWSDFRGAYGSAGA